MRIARRCSGLPVVLLLSLAILQVAGCKPKGEGGTDAGGATADGREGSPAENRGASSPAADRKHPVVRIETSLGALVVKLDAEKAGLTVSNFLQYANDRYYDDTIFHEVGPGYAVIGGVYTSDLAKKPTRQTVRNEAHNGLKNVRGAIAMAREPDVIDSATSGFFINLTDNPHLDQQDESAAGYGYCVFGEVIEGMDVAEQIAKVKTHEVAGKDEAPFKNVPVEPVVIRSIRLVR